MTVQGFDVFGLENGQIMQNRLFRAGVAAVDGGVPAESDGTEYFVQLTGDGDASNGDGGIPFMVIRQADLSTDVVGVQVELQTGHGYDFQFFAAVEIFFICRSGLQDHASQVAGGCFLQVLAVAVRTKEISHDSVFHKLNFSHNNKHFL